MCGHIWDPPFVGMTPYYYCEYSVISYVLINKNEYEI